MGDFETLKEAMDKMKEKYKNLISDRNNLLEVKKTHHNAIKREEYEEERLGYELKYAYVSLESTQKDIQESKLQLYKLQKELYVPHLSSCMEGNASGIMEEIYVEDEHDESSDLQVLVKGDAI